MATRCCVSRVVGQPPLCPADPAPQSEPLDERQVANNAGGHAYPVDDMTRLRRFLILGSEGRQLLRQRTEADPGERRGRQALHHSFGE